MAYGKPFHNNNLLDFSGYYGADNLFNDKEQEKRQMLLRKQLRLLSYGRELSRGQSEERAMRFVALL